MTQRQGTGACLPVRPWVRECRLKRQSLLRYFNQPVALPRGVAHSSNNPVNCLH